ncbi:MAG: hypothetical protein U5R48_07975 [Gammaproteobacteria bacterium]|nr:hypothetical protein [Gammaproteobacteria bacterium]
MSDSEETGENTSEPGSTRPTDARVRSRAPRSRCGGSRPASSGGLGGAGAAWSWCGEPGPVLAERTDVSCRRRRSRPSHGAGGLLAYEDVEE